MPKNLNVFRFAAPAVKEIATISFCLLFSLLMIYHHVVPLSAIPLRTLEESNDVYHMIWTLWFVNESISAGHNPYHTNSLFYPEGANLAHHTVVPGYFPITFLTKLIMHGDPMYPIYAYRIAILSAFTLLLFFSYRFLKIVGMRSWGSAIAAVGFSFCDFFMLHAIHLNHVAAFFFPLVGICLVRFYRQPKHGSLLLVALMSALALYFTEFSLFIFLAALILVLAMSLLPAEREVLRSRVRSIEAKSILEALVVFAIVIAPFLYNLSQESILKPSYVESSNYSANLMGLFVPNPETTKLYGNVFSRFSTLISQGSGGTEVFVGFALMLFAGLGLITAKGGKIRIAALVAGVSFLLSLGPTLKVAHWETGLRLPYSLLMRVTPFDIGRTPVRFVVVGMFFLMILAASGLSHLETAIRASKFRRWPTIIMGLLFAWTAAEVFSPTPRQPSFTPPTGIQRINSGPVLNLPAYSYDGYAALLQVFHHQPIATGYLSRTTSARVVQLANLKLIVSKGGPAFCETVAHMGFRNLVISPVEVVPPIEASRMIPLELSRCSGKVVDLRNKRDGTYDESLDQPPSYPLISPGATIDFRTREAEKYFWYGWSGFEPYFRWTDKGQAAIVFSIEKLEAASLTIRMMPFLVPAKLERQRISVALNGQPVARLELTEAVTREYSVALPTAGLRANNVITFELPDADSPARLGVGSDGRALAVTVEWIRIDRTGTPK